MGIYIKKKRNTTLKVFIFLFSIFFLIFLIYYFFLKNLQIDYEKSFSNLNKDIKEDSKIPSELSDKIDIDLNKYLKKDEINQSIKDFINQNPDFLLNVLKQYQDKINQLEQEKASMENLSNIEKLNSLSHSTFIGDKNANRAIYEFVDYNCSFCHKFHNEVVNVIANDPSIKLIIIQMPILGTMSDELSKLALAASLQGKFIDVHNYLYSSERKSNMDGILADLFLMNIDLKKLEMDLTSDVLSKLVLHNQNIVNDFKFTGTPAIIIGNKIIPGFIKSNQIIEILDEEFS